jgi:hypothetical protein
MPKLNEALLRHAKYYSEILRHLYDKFRRGGGEEAEVRVQQFNENWPQIRAAQSWAEMSGAGRDGERLFQDGNLATLNVLHQERSLEFAEAIKEYATLFGTKYLPDVELAEMRFGLLIDQSRVLKRPDLLQAAAEALHEHIRSLRTASDPHDYIFEVLFRLVARINSPSSTSLLLEMIQWNPQDINYTLVREMAAEALASSSDPTILPILLRLARNVGAPRSSRRCAVYSLRLRDTQETQAALLSLKMDSVVGDLISE